MGGRRRGQGGIDGGGGEEGGSAGGDPCLGDGDAPAALLLEQLRLRAALAAPTRETLLIAGVGVTGERGEVGEEGNP